MSKVARTVLWGLTLPGVLTKKNKIMDMRYNILDEIQDENFKNDLHNNVIKKIIDLNDTEIEELYNKQREHYKEDASSQSLEINKLTNKFNIFKDKNIEVLGIDLPCWIDWGAKKSKVMIVGRDPQRNAKKQKGLIIGAPYSIVSEGGRNTEKNYWNFIEPLLENNRVYLTDIFKLYISNPPEKVKQLKKLPIHFEIFTNELQAIQPNTIITLGNDAKNAVKKYFKQEKSFSITVDEEIFYKVTENKNEQKREINVYFIPHISGRVVNGTVTISNLYKSIGKLKKEVLKHDDGDKFICAGIQIYDLKDKLFK